jgi:hypothetical protein
MSCGSLECALAMQSSGRAASHSKSFPKDPRVSLLRPVYESDVGEVAELQGERYDSFLAEVS